MKTIQFFNLKKGDDIIFTFNGSIGKVANTDYINGITQMVFETESGLGMVSSRYDKFELYKSKEVSFDDITNALKALTNALYENVKITNELANRLDAVEKFNEKVEDNIEELNDDLDSIYEDYYEIESCDGCCTESNSDDDDCTMSNCDDGCCTESNSCSLCFEKDEEISIIEAMDVIIKAMNNDSSYYESWRSGIAMAYKDAWYQYKKNNDCKSKEIDKQDRDFIANDAAEYFLKTLL